MDQNPPKRRFRFGLRSLMLTVAMFAGLFATGAWYYRTLPRILTDDEVLLVQPGMSERDVIELWGRPLIVGDSYWLYAVHGDRVIVEFVDKRVDKIEEFVP